MRRPQILCVFAAALIIAASLLPAPARAQADQLHTATAQELAVVKVLLAQQEYWNSGNLVGFVGAYKDSPDTLFIGTTAILHGSVQIFDDYRRQYPNKELMGNLTYSEFSVVPLGENFAACTGKYRLNRSKKNGGNAEGSFSVIMEKTSIGWRIILDHAS